MNQLLQLLLPAQLLQPLIKPVVRLILGFVAVPIFRLFVRRVAKVQALNRELERDLELWIRGSLLLLVASANMEAYLFHWVRPDSWWLWLTRLLLVLGVIEGMPDQALFSVIHPGPRPPKIDRQNLLRSLLKYIPELLRGLVCQHLNRSSPVFAILCVVLPPGQIGWIFYGLAITQYLIIGLVSSRDKAVDVLRQYDKAVAEQRHQIEEEVAEDMRATGDLPASAEARVALAEKAGAFSSELVDDLRDGQVDDLPDAEPAGSR